MFLIRNNIGIENIPIEDSTLTENNESDYDEVLKHQKKYTKLLTIYTNTTRINLYIKILFKLLFFVITIGIWIYMINLFCKSSETALNIIKSSNADVNYIKTTIDLLATYVPSLVSLITSFIVIPKVIADYLFNINEESSMVSIITGLQTYDDDLYKHRYNEELLAHKEYAMLHQEPNNVNQNTSNINIVESQENDDGADSANDAEMLAGDVTN